MLSLLITNCKKDKVNNLINAPSELSAIGSKSNEIVLSWKDNSTNESGFEINRSLDSITGYTLLTITSDNVNSYSDNTVEAGKIYYYKIRAKSNSDFSNYSNYDYAESAFNLLGVWSGTNCNHNTASLRVPTENTMDSFYTEIDLKDAPCKAAFQQTSLVNININKISFDIISKTSNVKANVECIFKTHNCCTLKIIETESGSAYVCGGDGTLSTVHLDIPSTCISILSPGPLCPIVSFIADKTTCHIGETIQFTDHSANNPISWAWDFGDNTKSTDQNPSHIYETTGTYNVFLSVTTKSNNNTCSKYEEKYNYIKVYSVETMTDIDNNVYNTTNIGTELWTAENLRTTKFNDGSKIPVVSDNLAWSSLTTPAYCWANNDTNYYKEEFGALYNWYTVNSSKLCPEGWHVSNNSEWSEMVNYLGGWEVAGGKMAGYNSLWETSQDKNSSGFTAVPGGYRDSTGLYWAVYYGNIGLPGSGCWWTSTSINNTEAKAWSIALGYNDCDSISENKNNGLSIRCIKN